MRALAIDRFRRKRLAHPAEIEAVYRSVAEQELEAIEPRLREAAAEIGHIFKAAALQRAGGKIAALTLLAIDKNSAVVRQLAEPVAEFTQWNMHGILERSGFGHLVGLAHIEKEFSIRLPILGRDGCHIAAQCDRQQIRPC